MHDYYNLDNFPRLVWARKDSNWYIYANERGKCASIAVVDGAQSTQFGDLRHVADCKHRDAVARNPALLGNRATRKKLARWSNESDWFRFACHTVEQANA